MVVREEFSTPQKWYEGLKIENESFTKLPMCASLLDLPTDFWFK